MFLLFSPALFLGQALCLGQALFLGQAHAASLDNLEIGGPWGSPTATDATAAWWNPAGLAAAPGTRLQLEAAPTFATVDVERADPHGGDAQIGLSGVVPFAGLATDLGIDRLGLGASFAVPFVRGGEDLDPPSAVSYHLREATTQILATSVGAGWLFFDRLSVGASVSLWHSVWKAQLDNDTLPDLDKAIQALGEDPGYTDADLENPLYATTLDFENLSDNAVTWMLGVQAEVHPRVRIGAAFHKGSRLENTGDVTMAFSCPDRYEDILGRTGAEKYGICNTTLDANGAVAYDLPSRFHAGVAVQANDALRVEVLGGWVGWHVYDDFDIGISGVEDRNELKDPAAADLLNQERAWARDNVDSFWGGLDVKANLGERFVLGGRGLYDRSAVPDAAMSPNNYDANLLMVSGMGAVDLFGAWSLGFSATHSIVAERTVENSAFSMTVDSVPGESEPVEDRYSYPHMNGTYNARINRLGVQLRAGF